MNKCLRLTVTMTGSSDIHSVIREYADALGVEGIAQVIDARTVKVIVCGPSTKIDEFIDTLHKERYDTIEYIEMEPFVKERDYRGVFRVIE